jgi:hypothetical protein
MSQLLIKTGAGKDEDWGFIGVPGSIFVRKLGLAL